MELEVLDEYQKAPKCGEAAIEESWENELLHLLEQIKFGFKVRNKSTKLIKHESFL